MTDDYRWRTCKACDVRWRGPDSCWCCGQKARPSYQPVITSQHGAVPLSDLD